MRIIEVGNYTIMYAILEDFIYLEMPIENQIFATKKFFSSIEKEMQLSVKEDKFSKIRFFLRHYLKTKNYFEFYPTNEDKILINELKLYNHLKVSEANIDIEYDPDKISLLEDDIGIKIYQSEKLLYKLVKT